MGMLIQIPGNGPTILNYVDFYVDTDSRIKICAHGKAALLHFRGEKCAYPLGQKHGYPAFDIRVDRVVLLEVISRDPLDPLQKYVRSLI